MAKREASRPGEERVSGLGKGGRWRGCNKGEGTQLLDTALSPTEEALGSSAGDAPWGSIIPSIHCGLFFRSPDAIDTGAPGVVLPVDRKVWGSQRPGPEGHLPQ